MKTRELPADEIRIQLTAEDISRIPENMDPQLPADEISLKALATAMKIRGSGKNIFVCGPSGPEREALLLKAARNLKIGHRLNLEVVPPADREKPSIREILNSIDKSRSKLLLSASAGESAVIIENNPEPGRLFGTVSSDLHLTDAGSLLKSAGGLLVLKAEDLLEEAYSWKLLKRVLRTGKPAVNRSGAGEPGTRDIYYAAELVPPETVLDLKVAILGNESQFDNFYNTDEDFAELFQFFVEFDSVIEFSNETLADEVNLFRNFSTSRLGKKLTDEAALEAVKYSVASAENNTRLSTVISEIEQLIIEAAEEEDGAESISGAAFRSAVENQAGRFGLLERRILEDISSGEINLKVDGCETGKVNGLAVMDKGTWSFGIPGLISASTAPGESGLVNIEHEAGLSGEIHDKWVYILEGYLRSRFAHDFPISIFASICFEQSYSEIDGDSASSSELYALLSSIAEVPLRQDIAVTGSLSQTGEIQAVGGLREKIEGFYKTCKALSFTGTQGVIVPDKNIKNIILPDYIIEDIADGKFHIYPVASVDDSMELLTGMEAGKRNSRGQFPHGSLNALIEKNLKKLATQAKNFGN